MRSALVAATAALVSLHSVMSSHNPKKWAKQSAKNDKLRKGRAQQHLDARAASSAKSAAAVGGSSAFAAFASWTPGSAVASGADGLDGGSSTSAAAPLDPDLDALLKKALKRDPTTKLKALVQLRVLVPDRAVSALRPLLGPWARAFKGLVSHDDHRVRAGACALLEALVARTGAAIEPHLAATIGPWRCAADDPDDDVAAAARAAFRVAFSNPKARKRALRAHLPDFMLHLRGQLAAASASAGSGSDRKKSKGASDAAGVDRRVRTITAATRALATAAKLLCGPDAAPADLTPGAELAAAEALASGASGADDDAARGGVDGGSGGSGGGGGARKAAIALAKRRAQFSAQLVKCGVLGPPLWTLLTDKHWLGEFFFSWI